jgi:hypothetical protein
MVIAAPKVFCYGDSLTAGTSPPLNQEFPYAKHLQEKLRTMPGLESSIVRWKGYPGWTSSALLSEGGLPALLDNIHASAGTLDLIESISASPGIPGIMALLYCTFLETYTTMLGC